MHNHRTYRSSQSFQPNEQLAVITGPTVNDPYLRFKEKLISEKTLREIRKLGYHAVISLNDLHANRELVTVHNGARPNECDVIVTTVFEGKHVVLLGHDNLPKDPTKSFSVKVLPTMALKKSYIQ